MVSMKLQKLGSVLNQNAVKASSGAALAEGSRFEKTTPRRKNKGTYQMKLE
jgi:hypothetical protein